MIEFKMMCVQPIRINSSVYSKIIDDYKFQETIKAYIDGYIFNIKWLDNFTNKYRKFRSFKPIKLPEGMPSFELLLDDFSKSNFYIGEHLNLSPFFNSNESRVALLYDQRFFSFFIIYEFSFSMPEDILIASLGDSILNHEKTDMYNSLRRLLVKEESTSKIGEWGKAVQDRLVYYVSNLIIEGSSDKKVKTNKDIAMIGKNTGNITFYFKVNCQKKNLKSLILKCNAGAESINRDISPIVDNSFVCYSFFGRFHSIISDNDSYYYRYFPIQFHMQFMWFITGFYLEILEKLNDDINFNNSNDFLSKRLDEIDSYVNQIQFLIMHNEKFKLSIEVDHELILNKIEKNWNIEKSLTNSAQYIGMFKEYLSQRHNKRQEKAARRQNSILFIISCVQIIALVSVWADYLNITNVQSLPTKGTVAEIFSNSDNLLTFNLWMPAVLSLIIIVISIFAFFRRK